MTTMHEYMTFAANTAREAGKITLDYFQTDLQTIYKADDSPVTIADKSAEKLIRERITHAYPDHAIVGEEFGEQGNKEATHRWFIDPIDGTKSFICGVPFYGVLIALEINGRIEVGAAYYPGVDEMLVAATNEGCWWNDNRITIPPINNLSRAIVCYTSAASFEKYNRATAWKSIQQASWIQRGWGDAYGYLLVATGRAHLMIDPIMNTWDCAPFPVIFREAGGYCGDWNGNETIYGNELMACHSALLPHVHEVMVNDYQLSNYIRAKRA